MMRRLIALFALTACVASPPVAEGRYSLISIDGVAFSARATIDLSTPGQVSGNAPCNSFSGVLAAPLPAFDASTITSTEMACDDLPAEGQFFAALTAMTRAEVSDTRIVLSNVAGRSMIFVQP